jgi:hypothetical protein
MGRLPAEIRGLTPRETEDLVAGWNEAHSDGEPEAMSVETYAELVRQYG